jgi:hypothetical protein
LANSRILRLVPSRLELLRQRRKTLRALSDEIDVVWGGIMTAMSTGVRFTALYAARLVASLTEIRDVIRVHAGVNVDAPKAQHHWQEPQQKAISDQDEIILNLRRAAPERT